MLVNGGGEVGDIMMGSLSSIGASVDWFCSQINKHGLRLRNGAGMGPSLNSLCAFRRTALAGELFSFPTSDAAFSFFMDATAADAITKAVHQAHLSGFMLPEERWRHFCKDDPIVFRGGTSMKNRNLVWETIIACLVATYAENVRFTEPDVVCRFRGRSFCVAAKVCYSDANVSNNVIKGFKQAENKADAGLVFLDVAALWDQAAEFRLSGLRNHTAQSHSGEQMKAAVGRWCSHFDIAGWSTLVSSRRTRPIGVAFFVPLLLQVERHPVPMLYTHLPVCWGEKGPDMEFATAFVRACDTLLQFEAKES